MTIIDPSNPVYNTVIFYILIMTIMLVMKPEFIYDHKNDMFKTFGLKDNQTIMCLPITALCMGVLLYMIFLSINIITNSK